MSSEVVLTELCEFANVPSLNMIAQGAEARVYLGVNADGRNVIIKHRFSKAYRHPSLDDSLRLQRTRAESRSLARAAAVLGATAVPGIVREDLRRGVLVLEHIAGPTLRRSIDAAPEAADALVQELGRMLARLHAAGIVHGDLTTSNVIVREVEAGAARPSPENVSTLVLLDFGLGRANVRPLEIAEDLHLARQAFAATHATADTLWEELEGAYWEEVKKVVPEKERDMRAQLAIVDARGRKK